MKVLVTGGGTVAPIDDVRTITNVSTGRFAASISESALARGAEVWHVHAPSAALPLLRHARFDPESPEPAAEMGRLEALRRTWNASKDRLHLQPLQVGTVAEYASTLEHLLRTHPIDVAFLAMAVSDFEPDPHAGKLSSSPDALTIRCRRTTKVIRSVRDWSPGVYLVGFKLLSRASTDDLIAAARTAGRTNRADLTVANDLQILTAGRHTVHLVRQDRPVETLGPGPDLADRLVSRVLSWAGGSRPVAGPL
ncbi:phosphopantothenoylcysteine decarboxylase domain-containing protein [Aquisphaera insulae]|uniref:phosphopantothenoylcysteine decarboxylase domain-containing protein n=1 Tax=Aquisphaera insulae TaxID=2712864 RepID=UPI0013EAB269|nr:phosphopantothenoylcysteine decarboxylase [Aquisphaera insulae]